MTHEETEFVVFCIEELAVACDIPSRDMYHLLSYKTKMIEEYIVPNYEVLHSMGRDKIVEELKSLLQKKGVL